MDLILSFTTAGKDHQLVHLLKSQDSSVSQRQKDWNHLFETLELPGQDLIDRSLDFFEFDQQMKFAETHPWLVRFR
jgi:hypothetical protein